MVMVVMKGAKIINLHNSTVGEGNHFLAANVHSWRRGYNVFTMLRRRTTIPCKIYQ